MVSGGGNSGAGPAIAEQTLARQPAERDGGGGGPSEAEVAIDRAEAAPPTEAEPSEPSPEPATLLGTDLVTPRVENDSDKPATYAVSEHLNFVAKVDVGVAYNDNILISHSHRQSDFVFTLSATFAIGLGDVRPEFKRLALDTFAPAEVDETYQPRSFFFLCYTPTLRLYVSHEEEDALDHDVALEGRWQMAYLTLGFRTQFQSLTTPDVDVGGLVRREIFSQEFSATYDYSDRTSLEFTLAANGRHYSHHTDSIDLTSQNWLNYRVGAWTDAALGVTVGYVDVEHGMEQVYEQVLARARYHPTDKIVLSANAGVEFRQSDDHDRATPVFGISANYTPFDQTLLTLEAARRTENSASTPGANIEYTGFAFSARQRFAQHYYLGLSASYQNAHYYQFSQSGISRDDDIFSIRSYLRAELSRSAAVEAGYSFQRDSSDVTRYSFEQNQVYLHFDVLF